MANKPTVSERMYSFAEEMGDRKADIAEALVELAGAVSGLAHELAKLKAAWRTPRESASEDDEELLDD